MDMKHKCQCSHLWRSEVISRKMEELTGPSVLLRFSHTVGKAELPYLTEEPLLFIPPLDGASPADVTTCGWL
ncbi:hypothetical protein AGOR_G00151470 [Albula goreensis]|uniref:Uncharacterized protein n=1 Tax=Albula goreensis TaxID=1534307 RepID=A0A8T3D3F4_9TELE|nr:hypothetical protein AGOR_G00151470 [Albula goreensis]